MSVVICFYDIKPNDETLSEKEFNVLVKSLFDLLDDGNHYKADINYNISKETTDLVSIESVEWELSGAELLRAVCTVKEEFIGDIEQVLPKSVLSVLNSIVTENNIDLTFKYLKTILKENKTMVKKVVAHLLDGKSLTEAIKLTESKYYDDKVQALLQLLDLNTDIEANYDRVGQESYNDNVFYIDDRNNAFLICTDDEADEEFKQSIENLVDDIGFDAFSGFARDYILENCCDEDVIIDYYQDDQRGYAEDIQSEDDPITVRVEDEETGESKEIEVHNRLFKEIIENNIAVDDDFYASDFDEDGEYIGDNDLVELWCDYYKTPEDQGYDSAYEWLEFNFGKDYANKFVEDRCDIDWDAVADYIKGEDGRGSELNGWDGSEHEEEVNGETYYIYPQCDWEDLDLTDAEDDGGENIDTGEE